MRIEMSRTFPVSRTVGFEYITDVANWPDYLLLTLPEGKQQAWSTPGDRVEFTWRPFGFPLQGEGVIHEIVEGEHVRAEFRAGAYPPVTYELRFENAGAHAFTLDVVVTVPDAEVWWKSLATRLAMMGPLVRRDVRTMMDRLELAFTAIHAKRTGAGV